MGVNPRKVIKGFVEKNFSISGWVTAVNNAWWESSRQNERQIYIITSNDRFQTVTAHEQEELDRSQSPTRYEAITYLYISAPNEDQREVMMTEMIRIFQDTSLSHNPTDAGGVSYGINDLRILNDYNIDKDKKYDCLSWVQVFEVQLLW